MVREGNYFTALEQIPRNWATHQIKHNYRDPKLDPDDTTWGTVFLSV